MGDSKRLYVYSINFGEHKGIVMAYSRSVVMRQLVEKYGKQMISIKPWVESERFNGNKDVIEIA